MNSLQLKIAIYATARSYKTDEMVDDFVNDLLDNDPLVEVEDKYRVAFTIPGRAGYVTIWDENQWYGFACRGEAYQDKDGLYAERTTLWDRAMPSKKTMVRLATYLYENLPSPPEEDELEPIMLDKVLPKERKPRKKVQ